MPREKKEKKPEEIPAWLITFSDMMTLMLTFFVLLVSMATMDEQRKLVVLGSIMGTFGMGRQGVNPLTIKDDSSTREPGPMNEVEDLEMLKPLLWEDARDDLRFSSNKFVQVFSIGADVLFEPGSAVLSERGRTILERAYPVLSSVEQPLLIAGHTASLRDEMGAQYMDARELDLRDLDWRLSLHRSLSVYRWLTERGLAPEKLRMEGFGDNRPVDTNTTAAGRKLNRRVDIVLDKRSMEARERLEKALSETGRADDGVFRYRGFEFPVERAPGGAPDKPSVPGGGS